MWRHSAQPRPDWQRLVTERGLIFPETPHDDGTVTPYWNEAAWYEITQAEVDSWERATEVLWGMCLEAVARMATDLTDARLRLPEGTLDLARESIRRKDPSVYGRFDLRCEGPDSVKMLELNGDTPTGLVETGVAQWDWKESELDEADQWNSVHERLVERWRNLKDQGTFPDNQVHFLYSEGDLSGEEEMTIVYMADCAIQAGLRAKVMPIQATGWNDHPDVMGFMDAPDWTGNPIRSAFKLYPWETMLAEEPAASVLLGRREKQPVKWIEPPWKVLMSTKALLPTLWEMYPDHPLLLPAYWDHPHDLTDWIAKPLQGREGDNIVVHRSDGRPDQVNPGAYGDDTLIYQEYAELPCFDGIDGSENYVMVGSWVIDGEAAGALFRESDGPVTDYYSRVVPHAISDQIEPSIGQRTLWRNQRVTDSHPTLMEAKQ